MSNPWNDPRILEVVKVLSERPNEVAEVQPRTFGQMHDEYTLALSLHKSMQRLSRLVIEELARSRVRLRMPPIFLETA